MPDKVLEVIDLKTYFYLEDLLARAVDGVGFQINEGEMLGLVGESGCGKSVTALSIMRLINPPGRIVGGEINFKGVNLLTLKESQMRAIRGNQISMIFQEPKVSLNPVFTIGAQIEEAIRLHQHLNKRETKEEAIQILKKVGLPNPAKRLEDYPHQFSGGMCQRVMIAMALSCHPSLLIADEPTTALDVTVQAQILELLKKLQQEFGLAIILITHDLGVVAETCDWVVVMYAGRIVEYAPVFKIFQEPYHPYTQGLIQSIPRLEQDLKRLSAIEGVVPNLQDLPPGCSFHPRCPYVSESCKKSMPPIEEVSLNHWVRCLKRDQ